MKKILMFLLLILPLAAEIKILALSGSSRTDSVNKKLVLEAAQMARKMGAQVKVIDLKDFSIPFYDGDYEAKEGLPPGARRLRELFLESDAIIISSPEYNGSIPGLLKNALDWASRGDKGDGRDAYEGKVFAIMSASPSKFGGIRGLVNLRTVLEAMGGKVLAEQVTVPRAYEAFNAKGELINPSLKQSLQKELDQLIIGQVAASDEKSTK